MIKLVIKSLCNLFNDLYNYFFFTYFKIQYKKFPTIQGRVFVRNYGKLTIGSNVKINSSLASNPIGGMTKTIFVIGPEAYMEIGRKVGISNSAIYCTKNIIIEDCVFIGGDCRIYDSDFHSINFFERVSDNADDIKQEPVRLCNGSFIGAGTTVLKGVTIGEQSVIGAGSIVTKSVPPYQLWAGNPAKFIRNLKS